MTILWVGRGEPPQSFTDYVTEQDNLDTRRRQLTTALARLRTIEQAARNNPGLRGDVAWSPGQQRAILDALADLTQTVRWLVQQQVAARDPAD